MVFILQILSNQFMKLVKLNMKSKYITADLIWPTNNHYYTFFDSATFSMKSWGKNVKQGLYKLSLDANGPIVTSKYGN